VVTRVMSVAEAKAQVARPPIVAYALLQPPGKATAPATSVPYLIALGCPSPARKRGAAPLLKVSCMEVARPPLLVAAGKTKPDALAQASLDSADAEVAAVLHWLPALPR